MSACERCGATFHPEIHSCPVCGVVRPKERGRRQKLWYITNTVLVSFVATVVLFRTLSGPEIQIGMSESDCSQARLLAEETRYAIDSLASDQARASKELAEVSAGWGSLAENYVPGKYSWSTSAREHNWLERLAISTSALAKGETIEVEQIQDPAKYVSELSKLYPRFCS